MKKVLIVVVCLLMVGSAFALESAPSNKVGYVKITCLGGTGVVSTAFGLPFTFWEVPIGSIPTYGDTTLLPSMIVGTQAKCSLSTRTDKILKQGSGATAQRNTPSCAWTGTLETDPSYGYMGPGYAYYYQNRTGQNRNLVLAGEADTTAASVPDVNVPAQPTSGILTTYYSWKDPREVSRAVLNLIEEGFSGGTSSGSDRVVSQQEGTFFYYLTSTSNWGGALTTVKPGHSYAIQNRHPGHSWTYQYRANGNALMALPPASSGGTLMKMPAVRSTDNVKVSAPTPVVKTVAEPQKPSNAKK